jgi:cytidine deaminase
MSIPVLMFDKNQDYVVLTMEEVGTAVILTGRASADTKRQQLLPMSFGPDRLPPPGAPGTMGAR